jgi:DMSO reductase anchor subunit
LLRCSMLIGLLAERWLFFAEAEHAVSLYYGHR